MSSIWFKRTFITSCFRQRRQFYQGDMKKSPSTPNLNWRYAMTEDPAPVQEQEQVVRRRQRKVVRPRPRSELLRDRGSEETWVDGQRWAYEYPAVVMTIMITGRGDLPAI